jgi:hypothetical protein
MSNEFLLDVDQIQAQFPPKASEHILHYQVRKGLINSAADGDTAAGSDSPINHLTVTCDPWKFQ